MDKTLTVSDAVRLSSICEAAIGNKIVARLMDNLLVVGTARGIGDDWGCSVDKDVREQYLWVTTRNGFEAFWPIAELMDEVGNTFIVDYQE